MANTNYAGHTSQFGAWAKGTASGGIAGEEVAGPWGALAGAAIGGTVAGISNIIHNKKMKKLDQERKAIVANRPKYQIPQEVIDNQQMYKELAASNRLPGQSQIENQLDQKSAGAVQAAMQTGGNTADILNTVANINRSNLNSYNQLGVAGAQNRQANMGQYADANAQLSDYRSQAFDYNQNQPYEYNLMRNQALAGAEIQSYNNSQQNTANLQGLAAQGSNSSNGGGGYGSYFGSNARTSGMASQWGNPDEVQSQGYKPFQSSNSTYKIPYQKY